MSNLTSNFTLASDSIGYIYATEFTFVNSNTGINNSSVQLIWNLGDGTYIYNENIVNHIYNYAGIYTVTLSTFDAYNNFSTSNMNITASSYVDDYVTFFALPTAYGLVGMPTTSPFIVQVFSAQIPLSSEPLILELYAVNSKSIPYQEVPEKWNFINPTWKFTTDPAGINAVTNIVLSSQPIYYNNTVVGASAEASVYYVDSIGSGDITNNCPLLISATLQTSGFINPLDSNIYSYKSFSNSKVSRAVTTWQVGDISPDYLRVTGNYIDEIYPQKWTNVKIPTMITAHSYSRDYILNERTDGIDIATGVVFTYPNSNIEGEVNTINFKLSSQTGMTSISCEDTPLYFIATDDNGFRNGGYRFTTVTSSSAFDNVTLIAYTTANNISVGDYKFQYPSKYAPNNFVVIPTPDIGSISKIIYTPQPTISVNCPTVDYYRSNGLVVEGSILKFPVPVVTNNNTFNYNMSGFSGIYGIAIDPRNYEILAVDGEQDCLYKFSSFGVLLSTLNLSSIITEDPVTSPTTPSYISIDKHFNIWISLYNSLSVLKFDKNFNFLFAICPNNTQEFGLYDDYLMKPPVVETDRNNDIWVTYCNPNSSALIKYTSAGLSSVNITLSANSTPMNIAVDKLNNIWVTESFGTSTSTTSGTILGRINQYSKTGTLLTSISGINVPNYISLDANNNIWFTFGVRSFGYIDRVSKTIINTWSFSIPSTTLNDTSPRVIFSPSSEILSPFEDDEEIGALSVDVYNRVWVVDAITNNAHMFNADPTFNTNTDVTVINAKQRPNLIYYFSDTDDTIVSVVSSNIAKSASVTGDWTGNVWYQKYAEDLSSNLILSGVSAPFNVADFNNSYEIRKVNESFNMAGYMKSLAFPEVLYDNTQLFDEFLPAVVGDGTISNSNLFEDMGKEIYSKIANFTSNVSDVDTCNIDQLKSLAFEIDQPLFDYGNNFPAEIKNMLDLASVSRQRLWGCNLSGTNTLTNNIIDWNSPYTTLDMTLSADWYIENGIVDSIFNYLLTKNLWMDVQ